MASFIILWSILAAVCATIGAALLRMAGASRFDRTGDRFVAAVWLGLSVLSTALLAASLLTPLTPLVGAAVAIALSVLSLANRGAREEVAAFRQAATARLSVGALALATGVAAYTTQPVVWYDTGLYHYGVIRWLARFGAVAGLGLIHSRFGMASSWFALAAPFDAGVLEARAATLTGGFALLLSGFHFLLSAARCLRGRARMVDWVSVAAYALVLPVVIHWRMPISPTPSLSVALLTVVVAWSLVVVLDVGAAGGVRDDDGGDTVATHDGAMIPVVLSMAAVTMKLNAAPLAIVCALFYLWRRGVSLRNVLALSAVGTVFAAPVVGYQVVTTGCPFFPQTFACVKALPWTLDAGNNAALVAAVKNWARWGGPTPQDAGGLDWLWRGWFLIGTTSRVGLALAAAFVVAFCGFIVARFVTPLRTVGHAALTLGLAGAAWLMMFRARNAMLVCALILALLSYRRGFRGRGWLLALGLAGLALVLTSGPDTFFGLGYVGVLWACYAATHIETLERAALSLARRVFSGSPSIQLVLVSLLIAGGVSMALCRIALKNPLEQRIGVLPADEASFPLLMPPRLPGAVAVHERVNDVEYNRPMLSEQCWATEIPCAYGLGYPDVRLREPERGLSAGFRRGQRPDAQNTLPKTK